MTAFNLWCMIIHMRNNVKSSRWNVALPENTAKAIDQIYALAGYASRSDFLSQAAKSMIETVKERQASEQERAQGLLKMTGALKDKISLEEAVVYQRKIRSTLTRLS